MLFDKYKIVADTDASTAQYKVNSALEKGWRLRGPLRVKRISASAVVYIQNLVRDIDENGLPLEEAPSPGDWIEERPQ